MNHLSTYSPATPGASCPLTVPLFDLYTTPVYPQSISTYSYELPSRASAADKEIRRRLIKTQQHLADFEACIQMQLPQNGEQRMRNLISRAAMRPTIKFPSMKLDRTVQCESLLEYEAALLFDASYLCSAYCEQPLALQFTLDGQHIRHVPDYAVLWGQKLVILEYKFSRTITKLDLEKTRYLQAMLRIRGVDYQLLTEHDVRLGHRLENAKQLLRRGRQPQAVMGQLQSYEMLRRKRVMTLAEFGWNSPNSELACSIAKMLLDGRAVMERDELLSCHSKVRIADPQIGEQGEWA